MKRDLLIFSLIAKSEKPLNKYRIWLHFQSKEIGTEPTFLAATDQLEECGLISAVQTNEKARGGKPSKQYDLTLLGLIFLLAGIHDMEANELDLPDYAVSFLVEKYRGLLPEILDHWDRYKAQGVEDIAEICLLGAARNWNDASEYVQHKKDLIQWREDPQNGIQLDFRGNDKRKYVGYEPDFHHLFLESFFESNRLLAGLFTTLGTEGGKKNSQRWLEAMRADPELRGPYISYLENKKRMNLITNAELDEDIRNVEPSDAERRTPEEIRESIRLLSRDL